MSYVAGDHLAPMTRFDGDIEPGMAPDYVGLFEGAGGWAVAARRRGLHGYGVELDPAACATLRAAGFAHFEGSVTNPMIQGDPRIARVPGLIASPPCQTFSAAGKGKGRDEFDKILSALRSWAWNSEDFADPRTALVLEPARWILQRMVVERPFQWIAMEQVPTCLPIWSAYAEMLEALGYWVDYGVLSAEQYGVPQTRKRAILVAHREAEVYLPAPTHSKYHSRDPKRLDEGVLPWVSMAEALGWDPDLDVVSNYGTGGDASRRGVRHASEPSATVTEKVGRNRVVLRIDRQAEGVRYARPIDRPAATLKAGHSAATEMAFVDDTGEYRITTEEAGVLQTFSRNHPWQGTRGKRFLQIGNAVPCLLADAVLGAVVV